MVDATTDLVACGLDFMPLSWGSGGLGGRRSGGERLHPPGGYCFPFPVGDRLFGPHGSGEPGRQGPSQGGSPLHLFAEAGGILEVEGPHHLRLHPRLPPRPRHHLHGGGAGQFAGCQAAARLGPPELHLRHSSPCLRAPDPKGLHPGPEADFRPPLLPAGEPGAPSGIPGALLRRRSGVLFRLRAGVLPDPVAAHLPPSSGEKAHGEYLGGAALHPGRSGPSQGREKRAGPGLRPGGEQRLRPIRLPRAGADLGEHHGPRGRGKGRLFHHPLAGGALYGGVRL